MSYRSTANAASTSSYPAFTPAHSALARNVAAWRVCRTGSAAWGRELEEVLKAGKLRHLGIPYANFITEERTGLDVELMQLFAAHLGVKYAFVETNWTNMVADLTGKVVKPQGDNVELIGENPVRGDVIATGTPSGVGFARDPQCWLQPGDSIEIEIDQIGCLENRVADED